MGCRCCNKTVRACSRRSYLEVDGYGAELVSIGGAGIPGFNADQFGTLEWGNAHIPKLHKRDGRTDPRDWSGLYDGLFASSYFATDWCWLQYKGPTRVGQARTSMFMGESDRLEWAISRNGDTSGFTNKSWQFLGVHFSDTFGVSASNHFYVQRFQWTWSGTNYTADVYIPEAAGRDWDNWGYGETGGYVLFNGKRYSMDATYHGNPPPGAFSGGGGSGGNSMAFVTYFSLVGGTVLWRYPDAGTTTTDAGGGTTTTHDIDVWKLDLEWTASNLYDYLCHTYKGQVDGLCEIVGRHKYRRDCDEVQNYSSVVPAHTTTYIKKLDCSQLAKEDDSTLPPYTVPHTVFTTPADTSCVGQVTTTTGDVCDLWSPPLCSLSCFSGVNEPIWGVPVNCKYEVTAHNTTWELYRSWGEPFTPSHSARKAREFVIAKSRLFRTEFAPHAILSVVNSSQFSETSPFLVLKLGVQRLRRFGEFGTGRDYFTQWLAAYSYDLSASKTVDLIRDSNLVMNRVWQYGEPPPDYCNELQISDYRGDQQHNINGAGGGFVLSFGFLTLQHPYRTLIFDIAEWLTGTTTTPSSQSGQFSLWGAAVDVPVPYSCIGPLGTPNGFNPIAFITDPFHLDRPVCSLIDDGLTDEQLYDSIPNAGDPPAIVPMTVYEYWIDMPASVTLGAK